MYHLKKSHILSAINLLIVIVLLSACQGGSQTPETTIVTTLSTTSSTFTTVVSATTKAESAEEKLGVHTTNATGEQRFVSVLVNFPDVKRTVGENFIRERMTVAVADYLAEVSYNKLKLLGEATKIYKLPNPVSAYRISPYNLEVDPARVISLVNDSVNAADTDVNFSDYSYITLNLGATPKEYGMIGYCAIPGMLGW